MANKIRTFFDKRLGIRFNNPTKYVGGWDGFSYVMILTFLEAISAVIKLFTFSVVDPQWWIVYCFWWSLKDIKDKQARRKALQTEWNERK